MADAPLDTLISSPWVGLTIFAIVMAAAVVQVGLGMGFGLTSAPLLAIIDPGLVPAPTLLLGMATASWGAFVEREGIKWPEVRLAALARIAGAMLAGLFLAHLADRDAFSVVFGILIALAVVLAISGRRIPFSPLSLGAMGGVSGFMGTITSVGAPPLALIYHGRPPTEARPTLAAFFAAGCAISLAVLFANGWVGQNDIVLAAFMAVPMMVGLLAARYLRAGFDRRYANWLRGVSALAAVVLIIRGLAGMV